LEFLSILVLKNISVLRNRRSCYVCFIPPRLKRGDRDRHERGVRDAVDVAVLTDERRRRGRRSRVVPTPRRWRQVLRRLQRSAARRWWQSSIGSPRRARSKPVNQPRREGRSVLAPTPVDFAPFARLFRARAHGCRRALGLPCALSFEEGRDNSQSSDAIAPRGGFVAFSVV
jgi:hypothetical protein